jgi:hypothetical protein
MPARRADHDRGMARWIERCRELRFGFVEDTILDRASLAILQVQTERERSRPGWIVGE